MPYALVLDKLIKDSNMTIKEIANRCKDEGTEITASYISILRKPDNERKPSPEVSATLERVLKAPENSLVIEGFMDTAPDIIRTAIRNLQKTAVYSVLMATHNPDIMSDGKAIQAKIDKELEDEPLYTAITSLLKPVNIEDFKGLPMSVTGQQDDDNYTINMETPQCFTVTDNAMYPTLPEKSYVQIATQKAYKDGDIVAYTQDGKKGFLYRQWSTPIPDVAVLTAFNSEFPPIKFDSTKMHILGKVIAVTKTL